MNIAVGLPFSLYVWCFGSREIRILFNYIVSRCNVAFQIRFYKDASALCLRSRRLTFSRLPLLSRREVVLLPSLCGHDCTELGGRSHPGPKKWPHLRQIKSEPLEVDPRHWDFERVLVDFNVQPGSENCWRKIQKDLWFNPGFGFGTLGQLFSCAINKIVFPRGWSWRLRDCGTPGITVVQQMQGPHGAWNVSDVFSGWSCSGSHYGRPLCLDFIRVHFCFVFISSLWWAEIWYASVSGSSSILWDDTE